jgi:hypothetical protein
MSTPTYIKDFKQYTRETPSVDDLPAMEQEFYGEGDRAVTILQAALVETILESSIERVLQLDLTREAAKEIFQFEGPIGNFSGKITTADALGIFGPKTRHDLDLIRLMRNQFAHCRKPLKFSTAVVSNVCKNLWLPDIPGISLTPMSLLRITAAEKVDMRDPKTRYITSCHSIAVHLLSFNRDRNKSKQKSKASLLP